MPALCERPQGSDQASGWFFFFFFFFFAFLCAMHSARLR